MNKRRTQTKEAVRTDKDAGATSTALLSKEQDAHPYAGGGEEMEWGGGTPTTGHLNPTPQAQAFAAPTGFSGNPAIPGEKGILRGGGCLWLPITATGSATKGPGCSSRQGPSSTEPGGRKVLLLLMLKNDQTWLKSQKLASGQIAMHSSALKLANVCTDLKEIVGQLTDGQACIC